MPIVSGLKSDVLHFTTLNVHTSTAREGVWTAGDPHPVHGWEMQSGLSKIGMAL